MQPTVETKIWMALKSRINSYSTSMPKLMPGEKYARPSGDLPLPYIRVGRVVTDPVGLMISHGQRHDRTGFLMLTVVEPLGHPVEVYDNNAGLIAQHFVDGTSMRYQDVCVTVTDYPYVMDGFEESGYWETPVRIPWRCFA